MNFSDWMSCLKDDAKLINIVMPGSHNSGCRKMPAAIANCQSGDLAEQFRYGVRLFDLRLDTGLISRKVVYSHSLIQGQPIENDLIALRKVLEENPSEFVIIMMRDYGHDSYGPFHFHFHAEPKAVDKVIEKCLNPSEYALIDFDKIGDVTMGDIRKSGKKYIIVNKDKLYEYSVNAPLECPWSSERHGRTAEVFAERATEVYDQIETDGIFVLQTQQTCGPGTDIGISTPKKIDDKFLPFYEIIINKIRSTPKYLQKVNVIFSDYMTRDYFKAKKIIALNLDKGNVAEDKISEFNELVK